MKRIIFALLTSGAIIFCLWPATVTAQQAPEQAAQQAGEEWLTLIDTEKYAQSWEAAAQAFKSAVSKEQWVDAVKAARGPLGKLGTRKLKSATYTKTLAGAPEGEYVVLIYESEFEHKQGGQETVTPMKNKDGQWRVSGYYVK